MTDLKRQKQLEFLSPFIQDAEYTLQNGMQHLKYFNCQEATEIENELTTIIQQLKDIPASKEEIKNLRQNIEMLQDYSMHLFQQAFMNVENITVNENFTPPGPTEAHQRYLAKLMKAFDAKQKHAPGFDGCGGRPKGEGRVQRE